MSDLSIDQVLLQIRTLSSQAGTFGAGIADGVGGIGAGTGTGATGATAATGAANASGGPPFAQLLKQGIDAVNSTQQSADALSSAWERGDPSVNLAQVMIETQKASVSFQALAQVRDRLISAYQDIMNMSI